MSACPQKLIVQFRVVLILVRNNAATTRAAAAVPAVGSSNNSNHLSRFDWNNRTLQFSGSTCHLGVSFAG